MNQYRNENSENYAEYDPELKEEIEKKIEKINEQKDKLKEELKQKYKSGNKATPSELIRHQEKMQELDKQKQELGFAKNREEWKSNIEDVRKKSEFWADRFEKEWHQIGEDAKNEKQKRKNAKAKGVMYIEPDVTSSLRATKLETKIELAKNGITPDALGEIIDDEQGIWESGWGYFESKEKFHNLLNKLTENEAVEILKKGKNEGKYSDEKYYSLNREIRQHYGS